MEKEVKLSGDVVKVKIKLKPYKAGQTKRRVYTHEALSMAKEAYPKLEFLGVEKSFTLANYKKDKLEGEWTFKVKKEEKKIRKKSSSTKKEVELDKSTEQA